MLTIPKLTLGFNDAENYKQKQYKELFNQIFVRTDAIDRICDTNVFFIIGEKGTGKTAHAIYISNNTYKNSHSRINYIRETDYQKFLELKREKHLGLSDYSSIWTIILYLLIADQIEAVESKPNAPLTNFLKFRDLKKAINEYYAHAFSPEIIYALSFVEDSKRAAELIAKYAKLGGEETSTISFTETRFQTNLLYIKRHFEDAFRSLKLKHDHILFIDGIDIRPESIPYQDYLECVKGLGNAIWSVNNDFFPRIKDSKGRLKIVLLVRPDIFESIGLQNQNNKIRDNAVLLDWRTTYPEYRTSPIFRMADRMFSIGQQSQLTIGEAWDYYFPYKAHSEARNSNDEHSFIGLLRLSMHRPRDIVYILIILRANFLEQSRNPNDVFRENDIRDPSFMRKYSDYLLGEVKDQLSFYHTNEEYQLFLKFFTFLNGKRQFTYDEYVATFEEFEKYLKKNANHTPIFFETPDKFLQFLYELNVICYEERTSDEIFIRWCFRERSSTNLYPKIKMDQRYYIHLGLIKALKVGKPLKKT